MEVGQVITDEPSSVHHKWVYLNNEFISANEAKIPVTTQALNYGTGVFEGIRAYIAPESNLLSVFRLEDHIQRLIASAKVLRIDDLPDAKQLESLIIALLCRNKVSCDCYIRPVGYKKNLLPWAGFGVKLSGVTSGLSINSLDMGSKENCVGLRCTISNWCRTPNSSIPASAKITGNYVNSALAMEAAYKDGFDDAILLNIDGYVAEATTSNIFIVKDGEIITPPRNAHILDGITRNTVITLAEKYLKIKVKERNLLPSELLSADECFLSGTGIEIAPVIQINNKSINSDNDFSITKKIHLLYKKAVQGKLPEYTSWLTSVY